MARSCPDCGASLKEPLIIEERLSSLGYVHADRTLECPECPWQGTFGIPVESPTTEPPLCPVCGGRAYPYKLDFHRLRESVPAYVEDLETNVGQALILAADEIDVHWKCEDCWYRWNGGLEHLTKDVYSLGVSHLEGRREDD